MTLAYYIKKVALVQDERVSALLADLSFRGIATYRICDAADLRQGTDAILSLGGDGTFLAAARMATGAGLPVMGINFGRLGFLSENGPEAMVVDALASGDFLIEERGVLSVEVKGPDGDIIAPEGFYPLALNEVTVSRNGPAMLGVDVALNGQPLPVYWADGLLVATSSGSTAYSLSVGGPICTPDSKVLIVAPVSPHNLNVRPLIVPQETAVSIRFKSRTGGAMLSTDNRNCLLPDGAAVLVRTSEVRLRRLRLRESNFINALRSRLLWGEDLRNS